MSKKFTWVKSVSVSDYIFYTCMLNGSQIGWVVPYSGVWLYQYSDDKGTTHEYKNVTDAKRAFESFWTRCFLNKKPRTQTITVNPGNSIVTCVDGKWVVKKSKKKK